MKKGRFIVYTGFIVNIYAMGILLASIGLAVFIRQLYQAKYEAKVTKRKYIK